MRLLALLSFLLPSALASSGGPDAGGLVYTDSADAGGPSHRWLDTSGGERWFLDDDETVELSLPFEFSLYGTVYDRVTVSSNGVVFFAGANTDPTGTCPAAGGTSWTGIAAFWDDLEAGAIETETFGYWPYRSFVISWPTAVPSGSPSTGRFQVWLLEGRGEAVVVLDDLSFGSAADNGSSAVIGVSGSSAGTAYACDSSTAGGTSIWFGDDDSRPARSEIGSDDLDAPWIGSEIYEQSGTALLAVDLNDDGYDELLVGAENFDAGVVWLISGPDTPGFFADSEASFVGAGSLDAFGAALAAGDLDGDGSVDLAFGAPDADIGATSTGAVFFFSGGGYAGPYDTLDSTGAIIGDTSARPRVGESLSLNIDLNDDGYLDVIAGAPHADDVAADAGKAYLYHGSVAGFSGVFSTTAADATFSGEVAVDLFGTALAGADLDGDGALTDLFVGAPGATNAVASDGGAVFLVPSGTYSGNTPAAGLPCALYGASSGSDFGSSVLSVDLDGSGLLDLIVGSPRLSGVATDAGGFSVLNDLDFSDCGSSSASFDVRVEGSAGSERLGSSLAAGDLDDDGQLDLVASAPNFSSGSASSAGAAAVWLDGAVNGDTTLDASIRLQGDLSGASFGEALAFVESPGARPELAIAAPYATTSFTRDGAVYQYRYADNFEDVDADGFVAASAGGNDCDDDDDAAHPGATDPTGDSVDGDCDGWVDGTVAVRLDEAGWAWDLSTIGGADFVIYDFETYTDGDAVSTYGELDFDGTVFAEDTIYGTFPEGELGGQLIGGTTNSLVIDFAGPVDALALRVLDPDDSFTLVATNSAGAVVTTYNFTASADDRPGGIFYGFTFVQPISRLSLTGATTNGFGVDDLWVAAASLTDRDLDGYTDADGDCDDDNEAINPGAVEVLGDGLDNDCDGLIDSGPADIYTDATAFSADAALDPQLIDFELYAPGVVVTNQYLDEGVVFDGALIVDDSIDGTSPNGNRAALLDGESTTVLFVEAQYSYGFYLLDGEGTFTIDAYEDFALLYSAQVSLSGGSSFIGIIGSDPVDELVITGPAGELWGIDDLVLHVIGRDDNDGDGQTEPEDCDDEDPNSYGGAPDEWYDGIDSDCADNDDFDQDGDGFGQAVDCDDVDGSFNPDADEVYYDGADQDCDGGSDFDADGDQQDSRAFGGLDCDDDEASTYSGATETWYDGIDSDCGEDDDYDQDGDGVGYYGGGGGSEDCDDTNSSVSPDAEETPYNSLDDDCDEATSDDDLDGDGHLAEAIGGDDCDDTDDSIYLDAPGELCYDGIDTDCDYIDDYDCDEDGFVSVDYDGDDCDDAHGSTSPGASEVCYDGLDQNCDGYSDFDCDTDGHEALSYGGDDCEDLLGAVYPGAQEFPYDGVDQDCAGGAEFDVDGDGQDADWYGGTDCDDTLAYVYAGAPDDCYDGIDADCAGDTDYDCDGDGYLSEGFEAAGVTGDDCDDSDASISPVGVEVAEDGIDQDCDLADLIVTDLDGDGYASLSSGGDDCDDSRSDVFPGAPEVVYDGTDADCAGDSDYDADADGDDAEAWGGGDCDDQLATVGSFVSTDDCGAGDEDCDGSEDEDCAQAGDSDDSEPADDTAPADDTDPTTRDTADSWRPAPETPTDAKTIPRDTGCGCDSTPGVGSAGLMMLGLLAISRRRRS